MRHPDAWRRIHDPHDPESDEPLPALDPADYPDDLEPPDDYNGPRNYVPPREP